MVEDMNAMYPQLEANTIPTVLIPYTGQRMDGDASAHMDVPESMKAVALPDDSKQRLDNTLVGRIIEILRDLRDGMRDA